MLVVIDTNILVEALRSVRGASNAVLTKMAQGQFRASISTALSVLHRIVRTILEYASASMSLLNITLPDSLFRRVESMAKEDGVSVDAFVAAVLSQRVAVADADSYVKERARRGSAQGMLDVLREAPDVEPDGEDKMGQAVGGA